MRKNKFPLTGEMGKDRAEDSGHRRRITKDRTCGPWGIMRPAGR